MADTNVAETHSIELNQARFVWQPESGELTFFGLPSVLFWADPSLRHMLAPLAEELGFPLFRIMIAYHASLGTDADYDAMVTVLGNTFTEGFLAWGRAVATAGWGHFALPEYDPEQVCATVVVHNPWELQVQRSLEHQWGCPFLQGKIIGIFTHALKTTCWADEEIDTGSNPAQVRFRIYAARTSLIDELQRLRDERRQAAQRIFADELARKALELQQAQAEQVRLQEEALQQQAALIAELSTPLIPIHDRVVLMPLIGQMDANRAQKILETLLAGVATHHAEYAILDITGMPVVDTQVAHALVQAARAIRLLGTEIIITGIRPEVAQSLVGLGADLSDIVARSTLQSGIAYATARIERAHA
jgi:rsbT co-antagonist protein RsbR